MDNNSYNSIIDILKKGAQEEIDETMSVNWANLQNSAREFLSFHSVFEAEKIQCQKRNKIVSLQEISEYKNYSSDMIKTANVSKQFYRALFKFDSALTKYLEEIPKRALYVLFDTQGRPHTYDMPLEMLANLSQGRGRVGRLNKNNLVSIEAQIDKNSKEQLEHIDKGATAAMGVNKRLERFYERRGKRTVTKNGENVQINAQKQGGLLMWKTGGTWKVAKVANRGVVGEAYANFLLTKHRTKQDYLIGVDKGKPPYYNHSLIAKFYKYLSTVTNAPSIVEEDLYTDWAQYAVKADRAGLPSPQQYIRTAYTILSSSDEIAPKRLRNMINQEFSEDSQLAPFVGEFTEENIENVIKEMLSESGFKDSISIIGDLKF